MGVLVSAVIPARDTGAWLDEALASARNCGVPGLEVIVVDDGSQPPLAPRRGVRWLRQEARGRGAARNRGVAAARGEWVAFLDADDRWRPGGLARRLDRALSGGADLVYGHVVAVDAEGRELVETTRKLRRMTERQARRGETIEQLAARCCMFTSTVLVRRDTLLQAGGYDESLPILEDLDLYLRLATRASFSFVDAEPVADYRVHQANACNAPDGLVYATLAAIFSRQLARVWTWPAGPRRRRAAAALGLALARARRGEGKLGLAWLHVRAAGSAWPPALARPGGLRLLGAMAAQGLLGRQPSRWWQRSGPDGRPADGRAAERPLTAA